MKKIMLVVLVLAVAAGAFFYGRSYERENSKYELFLTESEKETLRASFLASGATAINEDVFEFRWSDERGDTYTSQCDLSEGAPEEAIRKAMILFSEFSCYLDTRPEGRKLTDEFISSDSFYMP